MPFGASCGIVFQRRRFRTWLRNEGPLYTKQLVIDMSRGSQRGRTSPTRNNSSFTETLLETCSGKLLEFVSIANVWKSCSKKIKRINVMSTLSTIWHALGQGMAIFLPPSTKPALLKIYNGFSSGHGIWTPRLGFFVSRAWFDFHPQVRKTDTNKSTHRIILMCFGGW